MGMRRAQEFAIHHSGQGNIVGETRLSGDFGPSIHSSPRYANHAQLLVIRSQSLGGSGRKILFFWHVSLWGLEPPSDLLKFHVAAFPLFRDLQDGFFNSFENLKVTRAPAKVAGKRIADLIPAGMGILVQ